MESFDNRAIALVLGLASALERVSLPAVWAWATNFNFSRDFACAMRALRAPGARSV